MKITYSSCGGGGVNNNGNSGDGIEEDLFRDPKSWPPGFRFHPTDEELILYYLKRKICRRRLKLNVIKETDVYKWDPEELPGQSLLKSGDRQWYFFSPRDRKYPNGARSNRATRQGYWKATGKDRNITWNSRSVGIKKTLVFYRGRAPTGERTDWDYYALYKVFKKSGPGPKNGEQYGAPFVEEEWDDDEEETKTPDKENQVRQTGAHEETQSTMMGPSHGEPVYSEPLSCTHDKQHEAHSSFNATQSAGSYLPSCEAPEVTSISNVSEWILNDCEEVNYLEIDDLEGPLGFPNMVGANKSIFEEMDHLDAPDLFYDAAVFLENTGTIEQGSVSNLYMDTQSGGLSSQMPHQTSTPFYNGDKVTGQLWMHEQRRHVSAPSEPNHVAMAPPTSESVGVMHAVGSTDHLREERQNWGDNEDGDVDSWFTSAISAFLGSVPTRPALASENALVNRAFERMASFGRVRITDVDASATAGREPVVERRVRRNGGFLFFSVLGVLCAVLWMLLIGTTVKVLKNFLGRFISS
ncbi:hypothetical protein IFM89_022703 [Coptis chinensis]|uniref:NAC domain-containing protein n=1 Tax=Coptis chinensis TaxID=261450 RepID=A0A835HMS0_9MAGN|nr:hypothetical protein IFM89_022703 [Coptis chinensis]